MKFTVAYTVGRYTPPHKGHINYFRGLLAKHYHLIIGIASCYESGTFRHPLLAFLREKMIHYSLVNAGIDMKRVSFVHLQDFFNDWDGWWRHVTSIPDFNKVTHFVTGNEKEVLSEIRKRGIKTGFEIINPEKDMPLEFQFPYHATDLRKAIVENNYDLFLKIAASGTVALMGHVDGFAGIRRAMDNAGTRFIPGR
jgi:hypothetical protein